MKAKGTRRRRVLVLALAVLGVPVIASAIVLWWPDSNKLTAADGGRRLGR